MDSMGLIHRDLRPANLMVFGRGEHLNVKVIDLGHMLGSGEPNRVNKSMVIRCHWHKETETKRFDWAPPEVKLDESALNFERPTYAFDIFSLGALAVQLCIGKPSASKDAANRAGRGAAFGAGALGLRESTVRRMLAGAASERPTPQQVLEALHHASISVQKGMNGEVPKERKASKDSKDGIDHEASRAEKDALRAHRLSLLKTSAANEDIEDTPSFEDIDVDEPQILILEDDAKKKELKDVLRPSPEAESPPAIDALCSAFASAKDRKRKPVTEATAPDDLATSIVTDHKRRKTDAASGEDFVWQPKSGLDVHATPPELSRAREDRSSSM